MPAAPEGLAASAATDQNPGLLQKALQNWNQTRPTIGQKIGAALSNLAQTLQRQAQEGNQQALAMLQQRRRTPILTAGAPPAMVGTPLGTLNPPGATLNPLADIFTKLTQQQQPG